MPEIENKIKQTMERVRAHVNYLPFKVAVGVILTWLVYFCPHPRVETAQVHGSASWDASSIISVIFEWDLVIMCRHTAPTLSRIQ